MALFFSKMEGTSGGEKEYLANIHSLRSKVLSVQTDIAECEKLYPVYTTEQGWTETEYQFTRCLEVRIQAMAYLLDRRVEIKSWLLNLCRVARGVACVYITTLSSL